MKSIFSDIDMLIEQAVANATGTEKILQKKQEKEVKQQGLGVTKNKKKEVDEVETDEEKKTPDDESIKKVTITSPKVKSDASKTADEKNSAETPGTKTSKKLLDPSEKIINDPKFSDVKDKINVLRGAPSLSDKPVATTVKDYLNKLSTAERSALLIYLTNLVQVMTAKKSPDQVSDPGDAGIKIGYTKKKEKEEKLDQPAGDTNDVIVVGGKS